MSKELAKEIRKIQDTIKSNEATIQQEVKFSELSFRNIYYEYDTSSSVNDKGEFVTNSKFRHVIGATFNNKAYSIVNPQYILETLLELNYRAKYKHTIYFTTSIGFYQDGTSINPIDLRRLLETATLRMPKRYNKLRDHLKEIGVLFK